MRQVTFRCLVYGNNFLTISFESVYSRALTKMAPPPPIRQNYTQEDLILAINAVRKDELSLREAQNMYNVPKDTIRRKVKDTNPTMKRPGPSSVLGVEEEKCLVDWIFECKEKG